MKKSNGLPKRFYITLSIQPEEWNKLREWRASNDSLIVDAVGAAKTEIIILNETRTNKWSLAKQPTKEKAPEIESKPIEEENLVHELAEETRKILKEERKTGTQE